MVKAPALYTLRVEVEPDDITHERAKEKLTQEMADAVVDGLQINGIREPVYGLDENGNRVVIAYEALAWACIQPPSQARSRPARDDNLGLVLTESGVAISL